MSEPEICPTCERKGGGHFWLCPFHKWPRHEAREALKPATIALIQKYRQEVREWQKVLVKKYGWEKRPPPYHSDSPCYYCTWGSWPKQDLTACEVCIHNPDSFKELKEP